MPPLSEIAARTAKPKEKTYKLYDEKGLYLEVIPAGGKYWRAKYRYDRKERKASYGVYPEVTLKEARETHLKARSLLRKGIDPIAHKKAKRGGLHDDGSFEVVTREWFERFSKIWAEGHASRVIKRLEADVFPYLGAMSIADVEPPLLLSVLRRVEGRGAVDTAHRVLTTCGQIFRYAIATGRAKRDISQDLKGSLPRPKEGHFAAITDPKELGALLRDIDGYRGKAIVRAALKLAPIVFVRPKELRHAEWAEIDLEKAEWMIPAEKMKMKSPHLIPLSTQAVSILRDLKPVTGAGKYVFPSARSVHRPMSDNAILAALRTLGYTTDRVTGHGFRATARTLLDEVLGFRPDYIEHQLAHAVRDPLGRAYNRTTHLPERRRMMQEWADYLDSLKA